jgi:nucleoid DNA-binding protein/antibiotic biosynthesis monooxygenase (ABM) superfamily enzyme
MDISSSLFELLQQHKEVGIASLGTFYKKKYPGRYDKEKQSFLPPGFTLQFSHEVREEDLLPAYISSKQNISIGSASHYITQFVEETTERLARENEAFLTGIGRLYFTEHEGLSFEPAQNITYGSEFFGLPALAETSVAEGELNSLKDDEPETYDEISEAPSVPFNHINPVEQEVKHPEIENIELDEVKDDFKNTLKHTLPANEITEAPDFIKEQHAEHPNRFGHAPEDEEVARPITDTEAEPANLNETDGNLERDSKPEHPVTAAPQFIQEQHTEHPNRFGHTPEDEEAVKAITNAESQSANSEEEATEELKAEEPVIEAPDFIKEQHAEHPNRFGNSPASENENISEKSENTVPPAITAPGHIESIITHQEDPNRFRFGYTPETDKPKTYINLEEDSQTEEPVIEAPQFIKEQHAEHPNRFGHDPMIQEEETPKGMSTWLKVAIVVLVLIIIAAITYLVKPELFTGQSAPAAAVSTVVDSPTVAIDPMKAKQDSIAKTDSILKVNQVQQKADTITKAVEKPVIKPVAETPKETKVVSNSGSSTFDVIAASFQSEKKALVFVKQMEKIGLKAKIANLPGRLKKVSVASFKTQREAEEQKAIIQKRLKGKGFFVQQVFNNTQP